MAVFAPERYWMVGSCAIERCAGGEISAGPEILVPMSSHYPVSLWRMGGTFTYHCRHGVLTDAISSVDMVGALSCIKQVNMSIDKAWQHGSSLQIYQFGMLASHTSYLVVCAHCQDTTALIVYCNGLRSWLCRIHCIDVAIQVDY